MSGAEESMVDVRGSGMSVTMLGTYGGEPVDVDIVCDVCESIR